MQARFISVFLLLGLFIAIPTFAQSHTDAENKILALENAWNSAQKEHDVKALDGILADSFVNTESDGSFSNKAQFLADAKDPSYKYNVVNTSDVMVFMYGGNLAVVVGAYHDIGAHKGKPFEIHGRFTDTWLLLNGKWQCIASSNSPVAKSQPS